MLLAVQIYAPLDDSPNHRTLYHFCCLHPKCQSKLEGWVCLRDESLDTSTSVTSSTKVQITTVMPTTVWVDDAEDWGDDENMDGDNGNSSNNNDTTELPEVTVANLDIGSLTIQNSNANEAVSIAQESSQTKENDNVPSAEVECVDESVMLDDLTPPTVDIRTFFAPSSATIPELTEAEFSSFYLNVMEEQYVATLADQKLDQRAKELWEEYQKREHCDLTKIQNSKGTSTGRIDEVYEKIPPSHGDRLSHKFITQVQSCPEQLIRYNRGASPLLLKHFTKDDPTLLKCRNCNSTLVYEMQLMPHLSQRLVIEVSADNHNPIELGTVLVFTCSKSCWNGTPREEYLVVQSEMY